MRTRIFGILLTWMATVVAYAATPPAHVSYTVAPTWKSGAYVYDAAGNIVAIGGDRYVYDDLNRLYDANLEEAADRKGRRYTYDAFGNLTKVEYTANGAVTRARTQNVDTTNLTNQLVNVVDNGTSTAFTYDAAGNVLRAGAVQYAYDAEGTMTGVAASQQSEFYVYAADGERIASVDLAVANAGSWTMVHWRLRDLNAHVVRELDEYPSSGGTSTWSRDHVYRGGSLLSTFVNNGTSEARQDYHLDHLGSPRLITDEQGYRVAQHDFFPFGEEVNPPPVDTDALKFTGHERDTGTSSESSPANYLDYMHARYYGTVSGRFLSVDPAKGDAKSPQSWNRYAYVQDVPIGRVDPDGRVDMEVCANGGANCTKVSTKLSDTARDESKAAEKDMGEAFGVSLTASVRSGETTKSVRATVDLNGKVDVTASAGAGSHGVSGNTSVVRGTNSGNTGGHAGPGDANAISFGPYVSVTTTGTLRVGPAVDYKAVRVGATVNFNFFKMVTALGHAANAWVASSEAMKMVDRVNGTVDADRYMLSQFQ